MSRIEELSIRGIRSFGHKNQDTQVIQFFRPLTLITGQNGAGKTSVIECLRYIATGDPPALTRSGAYFVHDPKVARKTEVEAQVKLKFTDVFSKTSTAEINSVVTSGQEKDKKKDQYKTRGVAIYRNRESFTYTLAEFGRQMVTLLGVSKPVLNNVIFCHQEDSNWPLGEGKAVKTKFDEIFAATRYRKALENMRKIRKEQDSAVEKYEIDIKHLKVNKEKAKELRAEYEKKKEQLSDAEKSVTKLEEDLHPIEDRLREISAEENRVASWCKDLGILGEKKEQMARSIQEIEDGLEEVFKGSLNELKQMHKEHQNTMERKKKALDEENTKLAMTKQKVESLRKKESGLLLLQGKMEHAEKIHRDTVTRRDQKIHETAQKRNIPGYDDLMYDSSKVANFIEILDDKVNQQKEEIANCTQKYDKEISVLDKEYQEFYRSHIKLNHTIQTATESKEQNKRDLKKIREDLNKVDRTAQQPPKRKKGRMSISADWFHHLWGRTLNVDELKAEIQQLQHEKEEKEATMSKLSEEVSALSVHSKASAKMEVLHEEKESKEHKIQEILGRLEGEEVELTGNISTERIADKLSEFIDQKHSEVQDVQSELEKAKAKIWNLEADRKILIEEVEKLQDQSGSSSDTWFDVCDEVNFEQSMENIQQSINTFHSEKGILIGSTDLFEQYVASVKKQNAKCPLCHRRFDSRHEMNDLFQELEGKLHLARRKLLEKATEILDTVNYSIGKHTETVSSREPVMHSMQEEVNTMKRELLLMDYCQNELSKLEGKIAVQSQHTPETDANRTLQQVISQWQNLHLSLRSVSQNLQDKQQLMEEQTERIKQKERLQEKEAELITTEQNLTRQIETVQAELKPVKKKIHELETKINAVQMEKEQDVDNLKSKLDKLELRRSTIASLTSAIDSYLNDGNKDKLELCQWNIKSINLQVDSLLKQQTKQEQTIKQLREDLAKQELQKRELENNLALHKKRMELEDVEEQIMRLEEKFASIDTVSLMNEKRNLNNKYSNMVKDKSHAEGEQAVLREVVRKRAEELEQDMYKQADFKYNDMLIKLVTTKEVSSDIEKYYKTLEKAIMKYHTLKMTQINKIIKEYWRKTYRGNDIDYIKICSDPDEITTIQARRTYNYRVVMVTGGAELDMRGRCSAGQKVLASLIIRLALAETFCLHCGILALDEPTTNLDEENMKSLADALVEIIDTPEAQRNIQLIVITHNENFVEQLGRSGLTDDFYRIAKNDKNKSVIRKENIANLQAIVD